MKLFNINEYVKVGLTEHGKQILVRLARTYPKPEEDGMYKFQMWDFMNIFGEHMYNGAKNVIEDNAILFYDDKLHTW